MKQHESDPIAGVFETVAAIEKEYAAHELDICGVRAWSALRRPIFEKIYVSCGITVPFQTPSYARPDQAGTIGYNLICRNPFLSAKRASNLIVKWERLSKASQGQFDPVSDRVRRLLSPDDLVQLDFSREMDGIDKASFGNDAINIYIRAGTMGMRSAPAPAAERQISALADAVQRRLGVSLELHHWFGAYTSQFRVRRGVYRHLLGKWGTRNIFVVVSYVHPALIAAAHDVGARVIELQHGLIGRYHVAYDFHNGVVPAYQPDAILLFGEFWKGSLHFAPNVALHTFGASHIRDRLDAATSPATRRQELLFISQPAISESLLDFALRFSKLPGAPKIIFRLHPGDDVSLVEKRIVQAAPAKSRFELSVGGGGATTLSLQGEVEAQVGVFSTAVVEGAASGCRTFVVSLAGWSSLLPFIEAGHAQMVSSPEDLLTGWRDSNGRPPAGPATLDELFARDRPEVLKQLL